MEEPNMNDISTSEKSGKDITEEFLKSCTDIEYDFHSFLRSMKTELLLEINLDLTDKNEEDFVNLARRMKAFLESSKPRNQIRNATIKCTKEQKAWEYNVFSSGVDWIESK